MGKDKAGPPSLAATTSLYETRVTRAVPSGGEVTEVCPADPRRWMLRVYPLTGGALVGLVVPDPTFLVGLALATVPAPIESKFRDAPDWTTAAWFGKGNDANGWIVVESLYIGG